MIRGDSALLVFASVACACATQVDGGPPVGAEVGDGDGDASGDGDTGGDGDGDAAGDGDGDSVVVIPGSGGTAGDGDTSGGDTASGGTSSGGSAAGGASSGGTSTGGTSTGGSSTSGGSSASGGDEGDPAGTVLFSDDFESGADQWTLGEGWTTNSDGTQVLEQTVLDDSMHVALAGDSYGDVSISGRMKILEFGESSTSSYAGLLLRTFGTPDQPSGYIVAFQGNGAIKIKTISTGSESSLNGEADVNWDVATNTWYEIEFRITGGSMFVFVDGAAVFSNSDTSYVAGMIGVGTDRARAVFDDIVVTAL